MKYLKQFGVILLVTFAGEILHQIIPLPIPASIYGLLLLLTALLTGILKLEQVKETGLFLVEIMPIMFLPAGVALIGAWDSIRPILVPVTVITVISTILVMGISGRVTQFVIRKGKKDE